MLSQYRPQLPADERRYRSGRPLSSRQPEASSHVVNGFVVRSPPPRAPRRLLEVDVKASGEWGCGNLLVERLVVAKCYDFLRDLAQLDVRVRRDAGQVREGAVFVYAVSLHQDADGLTNLLAGL